MDTISILLVMAGVVNVLLAIIIFAHGPRKSADISYAITVLGIILWVVAIISLRFTTESSVAFYSLAASFIAGVIIMASFWHFAIYFGSPLSVVPKRLRNIILIGGFLNICLALFLPGFIVGISNLASPNKIIALGPLHSLYILFFVITLGDAFRRLIKNYYESVEKSIKTQILLVILGTLATSIISGITNVFLTQFSTHQYIFMGPISTLIMVSFIGFAIIRHNLLNVKIIAVEIFVSLLSLILLVRFLLSRDNAEMLINGSILIISTMVGMLLIRASVKEVRDKEHISKLAKKLEKSNEELLRLDQAKSEFISVASHQLRTPLTVIRGYSSVLAEGTLGNLSIGAKDAIRKIFLSTNQLVKLVTDLLNLSRIEAGTIRYKFIEHNISSVVESVAEEFRPLAEKKNLTLTVDKAAPIEPFLFDSDKVREAINNLTDNAIKYSPNGGEIHIRVEKTTRDGKNLARVSIRDSGIGLKEVDQERLFTKFFRTEESRKVDPEGMGLGVYFARRVVEDHGGWIGAESEGVGKGSTFFIELPIRQK